MTPFNERPFWQKLCITVAAATSAAFFAVTAAALLGRWLIFIMGL